MSFYPTRDAAMKAIDLAKSFAIPLATLNTTNALNIQAVIGPAHAQIASLADQITTLQATLTARGAAAAVASEINAITGEADGVTQILAIRDDANTLASAIETAASAATGNIATVLNGIISGPSVALPSGIQTQVQALAALVEVFRSLDPVTGE